MSARLLFEKCSRVPACWLAHVQKSLRFLEVGVDLRVVGGILRAPAGGDGRNYSVAKGIRHLSQRAQDNTAVV